MRLTAQQKDGMVVMSIEDTGLGIAPDDLPKLFQKFSQVGRAEGSPKGTGLGLALCKELVELHDGSIWVESEPNHGSRFFFTLPVYTSQSALQACLDEQIALAKHGGAEAVSVIAIDVQGLETLPAHEGKFQKIDRVADAVRKHLHRGDAVVTVDPCWVIVLAATEDAGATAISTRLRPLLEQWAATQAGAAVQYQFATALYPSDGTDAQALLAKATHGHPRGPMTLAQQPTEAAP